MIKNKKLVFLNVSSSAFQVILVSLVYFFLYKFLLSSMGVELLGVWSVVLSTSSLATLANAGVTTSVVRFTAIYVSDGDKIKLHKLAFTASVIMLILFVVIGVVLYPFADFILHKVIAAKYINEAILILPYSIFCFIINAIAGIYGSILDGTQRNYIKSFIFSTSSIILLIASVYMVHRYGFKGLAFAQVLQSLYTLVFCMLAVSRIFRFNPFKWNWSKIIFKDIYAYGIKFQFISFASMFMEPLTKALLAKFGGLAVTGYYEMANRLLNQFKGVVVNACQSLMPVIINLSRNRSSDLSKFYAKVFYFVYFISLCGIGTLALSAGIISNIWIGHYENIFVIVLQLLGISFLINLLNVPAYFTFMSLGNLNTLIVSHLIMCMGNLILGFILGNYFSGIGIVVSIVVAIVAGSLYTILSYHKRNDLSFKKLFDKNTAIAFVILAILLSGVYLLPVIFADKSLLYILNSVFILSFIATIYFTFLRKQNVLLWLKTNQQ